MIAAALLLAAAQHGAPAACTPAHAAMGHCKMPAKATYPKPVARKPKAQPKPRPAPVAPKVKREPATPAPSTCTPEHAAMGHCTLPPTAAPAAPSGPSGTDLPAGDAPPPPAPRADYADRIFGGAMAASREQMHREHGGGTFSQVMIDVAEIRVRDGRNGYNWHAEGWFGGDRDRLIIKSEGHGAFGEKIDDLELEALYSRAIGPYFNLQAGVRHDVTPNPSRTHLAIGVEGLAPYWFELEAMAYLSDRGDLSGRIGGYYDQRITQRLILQPRAEVNIAAQSDRVRGIGSGISDVELGLRLRYELRREFAPYVGVVWIRRLGETARLSRAAGEGAADASVVAGVRVWF